MMRFLLMAVIALLPFVSLTVLICKAGYRPESKKYMWFLLSGGLIVLIASAGLGDLEGLIMPFLGAGSKNQTIVEYCIDNYLLGGFNEEILKWLFCIFFVYRSKHFTKTFDSVVFCALVSLGFAGPENLGYVLLLYDDIVIAVVRALLSVPGHFCYGVIMGYFLSRAKQASIKNQPGIKKYFFLGALVPILLHGAFDYYLASGYAGLWPLFIALIVVLYINTAKLILRARLESTDLVSEQSRSISSAPEI